MKKIISLLLICTTIFTTVFASSTQNKLNQTNQDIKDAKNELNQIKQDKKDTLSEIDNLDRQITSTEQTINSLNSEIKELETEIAAAENNIEYAESQYDLKNDVRKKRAATYYKDGPSSYWEILFTSESISDFFYRKKLLEAVMDFDQNLLDELEREKYAIESQKTKLEENKVLCENKKIDAENKKLALDETKVVYT